MIAQAGGGSALASWDSLVSMLIAFGVIVVALTIAGRAPDEDRAWKRLLLRPPNALERLTGIPGWAASAVGLGLFGLLVAGQGFYSDVAWHIALGRDDELFTAPHTSIVLGLILILLAGLAGIAVASLQRIETGLRWRGLRVPWSTVPLTLLGASAVMGFPLDELWHGRYGIDVTMWSPTHMLMILGASLSGMASWLVLADAGVSPRRSRWALGVHVLAAWLTLQGLASSQGEFAFGVPQFQQVYLPILVSLAAAFAIVVTRLVLGPWWAIGITGVTFSLQGSRVFDVAGDDSLVDTRPGGLYVVSAIAVELVARVVGTERRLRFAVASGVAVGTVGLAGEWLWNSRAYQPWRAALLPDAVVVAVIAGAGAAVLAAAFGSAVAREASHRLPPAALVVAGIAVLAVIAFPFPRRVGEVQADVTLERQGDRGFVTVTLDPPGAADDARWFQVSSWQGGGLELAEMERVGPGVYRSEDDVPLTGRGKTLVRLHRGDEMMAVPIRLPADPEIGKPEIPAVDRRAPFVSERQYLMRESHGGAAWFAVVIDTLLVLVAAAWVLAFAVASQRVRPTTSSTTRPAPSPSSTGAARSGTRTSLAG